MKEKILYDIIQNAMPTGVQFVNPYIDNATIPNKDFITFNIISIQDVGRSQESENKYNEETKKVEISYNQTRVYTLQIDFYGIEALENCNIFKQNLQVNLDRQSHIGNSKIGLKSLGITRNLTELLEDKRYLRRYSFDVDLFVIDRIIQQRDYIDGINLILKHY